MSGFSILNKIRYFWKWLWYSNSLASWIILFILAFLIVKFIFFPFSSLILKTPMPFVIVESYSMQHCYGIDKNSLRHCGFDDYWINYGEWYENLGINKSRFAAFPFKNGLDAGDIVVLEGQKDYSVGDIIVFFAGNKPIIHRVINKTCEAFMEECFYGTKGDNNPGQIYFEKNVTQKKIVGKAIFVIPKLGWIKLLPFKLLGLS